MVKQREYEQIDRNVFVLYFKMFPIYVVRGEKNFLIDSGVTARAGDFYQRIKLVLDETGTGKNDTIDTLLLTHSHWDHAGAASYLQDKFHFDITASHRTVELLQKEKVVKFIDRLNQDFKKMVHDTSDNCFEMPENLNAVVEGDTIRVDDEQYFEVIETPGHTKCSISYLLHPQKVLFHGDSAGVQEQNGSIKPLFLSSYRDFENSLRKLLTKDAEVLAFPHNKYIIGAEKVNVHLQQALDRAIGIKELILEELRREREVEEIADLLYKREFPLPTLLGPREALMTNFEAMIKTVAREFPGYKE